MNYEETYKDHKYLFDIGPASDMTGGYVDSEDLGYMLKNPSKKGAVRCLSRQIDYWFQVGTENGVGFNDGKMPCELVDEYPLIKEIADRHCCEF